MKEELTSGGQSVIEIIIALGVLALGASAGIFLFSQSQSFSLDAALNQEEVYLAHSELEKTRVKGLQDFSSLVNTSSTENGFLKETVVSNIDTFTKKVISRVSWGATSSRPQVVELTTIFTDWQAAKNDPGGLAGGGSGGGGLSGDWRNPRTLSSLDLGPGNKGSDLVVRGGIVYMTGIASDENKPDFFIIDATTPSAPVMKSTLNTGPGLNTVKIFGNYAYLGNRDSNAQLQIVDVTDNLNPQLVKSYKLPNVSGNSSYGVSIFATANRAYVGTVKNSGPEFEILDVTDPLNPAYLGAKELGTDVNSIFVKDNKAYLATPEDDAELIVLDVSDPANISQISSYDVLGNSEEGKSLFLTSGAQKKLYLGRTVGGNHTNHPELSILDVSQSTSTVSLGSKDLAADLNDLVVQDNLAFLAVSDSNKEFQVWDISDPANPSLWSSFNFPQVATGVDYENNLVYVSVRSNDALRIITSQ